MKHIRMFLSETVHFIGGKIFRIFSHVFVMLSHYVDEQRESSLSGHRNRDLKCLSRMSLMVVPVSSVKFVQVLRFTKTCKEKEILNT